MPDHIGLRRCHSDQGVAGSSVSWAEANGTKISFQALNANLKNDRSSGRNLAKFCWEVHQSKKRDAAVAPFVQLLKHRELNHRSFRNYGLERSEVEWWDGFGRVRRRRAVEPLEKAGF